jgi:hypothetical protein
MGKDNKKKKGRKSDKKLHISDAMCELKSLKKQVRLLSDEKCKKYTERPKPEKERDDLVW